MHIAHADFARTSARVAFCVLAQNLSACAGTTSRPSSGTHDSPLVATLIDTRKHPCGVHWEAGM